MSTPKYEPETDTMGRIISSARLAALERCAEALRQAREAVAAWGESACFMCEEASERDRSDALLEKDLAAIDAALAAVEETK